MKPLKYWGSAVKPYLVWLMTGDFPEFRGWGTSVYLSIVSLRGAVVTKGITNVLMNTRTTWFRLVSFALTGAAKTSFTTYAISV
jgi:hypothetical protein